jgi:hypothetical protein
MRRLFKLSTPALCLVVLFTSVSIRSAGQTWLRRSRRAYTADRGHSSRPLVSLGNWSQVARLIQQDGQYFGEFGVSVAIDGDTIAVCNLFNGGTFLFVRPPTGWRDMLPTATLSAPANAGLSVAISEDTIVVGSPDYQSTPGIAYVYVKPAGGWTSMGPTATLTPSDTIDPGFGGSVAISGDTIVVGDSENNSNTGAAYVFVKPKGGWTNMTQTAKLTASDGLTNDYFGVVSISNNTIAIGAPQNFLETGKAYIFVKPQNGWRNATQSAELTATDVTTSSLFGSAVSIDNDTIAVGAPVYPSPYGGTPPGEAYVYVKPVTGWTNMSQTAKLLPIDGTGDNQFGSALLVRGKTVVVSGPYRFVPPNFDEGGAYVFEEPANGWKDLTSSIVLTASGARNFALLGQSIGLSKNVMVLGAPAVHFSGVAYVFEQPQ